MIFIALLAIIFMTYQIWETLPSSREISEISCIEPIQIFTKDNVLIGEIGTTKRYPQKIESIPPLLQSAFIAVEDVRFYQHYGVDFKALLRAGFAVLVAQKKVQGGSTISMQVARNFYLKRHKTFFRKYKEMLLAVKLESLLEKNRILELYLNKIFLGHNSYGIEAAARTYFGKTVSELTLSEMASIAGLPKAPSVLNPISNLDKCIQRRNVVLKKMYEYNFIDQTQYTDALNETLLASYHPRKIDLPLPHVVTIVKDELPLLPEHHDYQKGGKIYTTIDSSIQIKAQESLDKGLESYDRRHSYRGVAGNIYNSDADFEFLHLPQKAPIETVVINAIAEDLKQISVSLPKSTNTYKTLNTKSLKYIRFRKESSFDLLPKEKDFSKFTIGDVIYITKETDYITQIPSVSGAIATLNNKGEVLALVSGLSYDGSHVNRAIQTKRQIGSTFKPFVYSLALDHGYNLDTLIQDSAIIYEDRSGKKWAPQNDNMDYMGSISFERSFIKSRNLSTLSLGSSLPLSPLYLSMTQITGKRVSTDHTTLLGSLELSPLQLASLYTSFINSGKAVKAQPIISHDNENAIETEELFSSQSAFIMRYMLGQAFKSYGFKNQGMGGKTGTTNEKQDLWFAGYKGNLVSVVWMGFDAPAPLYEYARRNSAVIWSNTMKDLEENFTESIPDGITFRINDKHEERPFTS